MYFNHKRLKTTRWRDDQGGYLIFESDNNSNKKPREGAFLNVNGAGEGLEPPHELLVLIWT